MLAGRLRSSGVKVSRKRMRECVANVDAESVRMRCLGRLKRRVYRVKGVNDLWHGWLSQANKIWNGNSRLH